MKDRIFGISSCGCAVILAGIISSVICGLINAPVAVNAVAFAVIAVLLCVFIIVIAKRSASDKALPDGKIKAEYIIEAAAGIIAVALQIYAVMHYRFENASAIKGIEAATRVFESGRAYFADPMMVFIGTISRIISVHPLIFIYAAAPVFITLYYLCAFGVICEVLRGRARFAAFVAVCVLNVWGYQSERLIAVTLLISWFGTWVFVVHGLLSVAAVQLIRYVRTLPDTGANTSEPVTEETDPEEWDMKNHKIINARNLAIALGVLAAFLLFAVFILNSKINKLYAATVNLQEDLNSRCGMYEFIPEGKGAEGYLIQGSDGTVSFIGGGGAENSEDLAQFLERYGSVVNNWYVYGNSDEDLGAMSKLLSSGQVMADNVYVITREEITGKW